MWGAARHLQEALPVIKGLAAERTSESLPSYSSTVASYTRLKARIIGS